jgi:hypothetical protein
MALKPCRECGAEVSQEAKTCPSCGIKSPARKPVGCLAALGIAIAIFAASALISEYHPGVNTPDPVASRSASDTSVSVVGWSYSEDDDSITGKKIQNAEIKSTDPISFGFPYTGLQYPRLTVRTHPRYGKNIILSIDRGQFICHVTGCSVIVRFDNASPRTFSAVDGEDHSTTVIFIKDYDRFLTALKTSKIVIIEAVFYHEGAQQIAFHVQGFDSSKLQPVQAHK